jgi:hypothetical protein
VTMDVLYIDIFYQDDVTVFYTDAILMPCYFQELEIFVHTHFMTSTSCSVILCM